MAEKNPILNAGKSNYDAKQELDDMTVLQNLKSMSLEVEELTAEGGAIEDTDDAVGFGNFHYGANRNNVEGIGEGSAVEYGQGYQHIPLDDVLQQSVGKLVQALPHVKMARNIAQAENLVNSDDIGDEQTSDQAGIDNDQQDSTIIFAIQDGDIGGNTENNTILPSQPSLESSDDELLELAEPQAQTPTLAVDVVEGGEDNAIALNIQAGLNDIDGNESLYITIGGVPEGATLSAGTELEGGVWQVAPEDLADLTITLAEHNSEDFTLTVTATATESNGDSATTIAELPVSVAGVADTPILHAEAASGVEDAPISLQISAALQDTDGSENLSSITIGGVPEGATLSAGTELEGGNWDVPLGDLDNLAINLPAQSDNDFSLNISVTATESDGNSMTVSTELPVNVAAVADGGVLQAESSSGLEDSAIALDISAALADNDGSEQLNFVLDGLPEGARLDHGEQQDDGSWRVDAADIPGLRIRPPRNFNGDFDLKIQAIATEEGYSGDAGDPGQAISEVTLPVHVDATVDKPWMTGGASGNEDSLVRLNMRAGFGADNSEEITGISFDGVPEGAELVIGGYGGPDGWRIDDSKDINDYATDNGDGSWSMTADFLELPQTDRNVILSRITMIPPDGSDADYQMSLTVDVREPQNGMTNSYTHDVPVEVHGVADMPILEVDPATGREDKWLRLDIDAALTDNDGSENLQIVIRDVPDGMRFNRGEAQSDGSWTFEPEDLSKLRVRAPKNFSGDVDLNIQAIATESDYDGSEDSLGQIVNEVNVPLHFTPIADKAQLGGRGAGREDQLVNLRLQIGLKDNDGSEELSEVVLSGLPEGSDLSIGHKVKGKWQIDDTQDINDYATEQADGSWEFNPDTPSSVLKKLVLTPPEDSNENFDLTLSATTTETSNGDMRTSTKRIPVRIRGVADSAELSAEVGGELHDAEISTRDIPDGVKLLAQGVDPESGELLSASEDAVTFNSDGFGVSGRTNLQSGSVQNQMGYDPVRDSSEKLIVEFDHDVTEATATIARAFSNDNKSGGTESGVWEAYDDGELVASGEFVGNGEVTINPEVNFNSIHFSAAPYHEAEKDHEERTKIKDGHEYAHDSSEFFIKNIEYSYEDTPREDMPVELHLEARLTDTDGSESLEIILEGIPQDAELSAGTDNGDGSWTLEQGDLEGLILLPPENFSGELQLTLTAIATEDDYRGKRRDPGQAEQSLDFVVEIRGEADMPELEVSQAQGIEDSAIALDISAALADTDGSESISITIRDVPNGAELSAGTDNGDGSWTLEQGDLEGLSITPPKGESGDFNLTFTATASENDGDSATQTVDFTVSVADPNAPEPNNDLFLLEGESDATQQSWLDTIASAGDEVVDNNGDWLEIADKALANNEEPTQAEASEVLENEEGLGIHIVSHDDDNSAIYNNLDKMG